MYKQRFPLGELLHAHAALDVVPERQWCCVCGAGPVEVLAFYRGRDLVGCAMATADGINGWVFTRDFDLCCRKHSSDRLL